MSPNPRCEYCEEPIVPGDVSPAVKGATLHPDCALRMVAGGVFHQLGWCSCGGCGKKPGLPPDPPNLTKRQAATMAADMWRVRFRP